MSDAPDPSELARRYLDLWQQHLVQSANDPELAAGLQKMAEMMPGISGIAWPAGHPLNVATTAGRDAGFWFWPASYPQIMLG